MVTKNILRKISLFLLLSLAIRFSVFAGTPKYVFLMIGDGMGINAVAATERYHAAVDSGIIGRVPLVMTQLPHTAICHTYSLSNGVTDSSAAGTALSTGCKTANGILGMDSTRTVALKSVAEKARDAGRAVGVVTSVSIDHATPGAFYAHVPSRKHYYDIGTQMAASGYEFFGGADFLQPDGKKFDRYNLHKLLADSGYTIIRGMNGIPPEQWGKKVFLTQENGRGARQPGRSRSSLPNAIDRESDDLTLPQITKAAIGHLDATDRGFFLMVEGGAIDWACHSNDAATAFAEIDDFDKAVGIAYEFYKAHPDETLLVVTADHETGGMALGNSDYILCFDQLQSQRCSLRQLSALVAGGCADNTGWEGVRAILADSLGFWNIIEVSEADEAALRQAYDKTVSGKDATVFNEYSDDNLIAVTAVEILNRIARCGWTTGSHSGAPVGIYAVGVGAEAFHGVMDNTDIPRIIADVAAYE